MRKGFRTFYHVVLWGVLCASLAACTPEPSVYIFSTEMCSTNGPEDVKSHTRSLEIRVHCHKEGYWDPCESFTEDDWAEVESRQAEDTGWHEKNVTYSEEEFADVRQQCAWAMPEQDMGNEEDMSDEPDMSVTEPDMTDVPTPEPPPQPRVTATGVKDGVRLEWAPVEGATSYQIKRLDRGTWEDVGAETSWLDEATDPVTVEELVFEAGDATHRDHVELTATYKSTDPVFYSYQVRALNKDVPGPESSRIEAARSHPLYHEFEALDEESTWQTLATEDDPSFLHTEAPGKGDYVDYRMRVVDADGVSLADSEEVAGRRWAVVEVGAGGAYTCAYLNDNTVWCWGSNVEGQIGIGSTLDTVLEPTQVIFEEPLTGFRGLRVGSTTTCVLAGNEEAWCWGAKAGGFRNGANSIRSPEIYPSSVVREFGLGVINVCFIGLADTVYCTGSNGLGQLGQGHIQGEDEPQEVMLSGKRVSAGFSHVCAVDSLGDVYCWGSNLSGGIDPRLPDGIYAPTKVELGEMTAVDVGCSGEFTCALSLDGKVSCWGRNRSGMLNETPSDDVLLGPKDISFPEEVVGVDLAVGSLHVCLLSERGEVWCWGYNSGGQLGNGNEINSITPVKVDFGDGVVITSIDTQANHTCASTRDGGMRCWGFNSDENLLGANLSSDRSTVPVNVIINGQTF